MNCIRTFAFRTFQKVMYLGSPFLKWRKPEVLNLKNGLKDLPSFIKTKNLNTTLLVVSGTVIKQGLAKDLIDNLDKEQIGYVIYDKVTPNPTIDNINEALALYKQKNCDCIIAFGGGSPMDCAKGVGAKLARPNKDFAKMKGILKVGKPMPPFFAIPTTAGSGSETTLATVITDSRTHEKYAISDPNLIPNYVILDAKLTLNLPKYTTASTGMDALTHAVEAYIGNSNTKETKEMAIQATKLIFENLTNAYVNGHDLIARENMQKAAFFAGVAFTRAYVGNVHAIAHTLGGMYGTAHGLANAIILPYILDFYGESAWKKLSELADATAICNANDSIEVKAKKFIQTIKDMNKYMEIPDKISEIKEKDLQVMADRAYKEANPLYPVPKIMFRKDYISILLSLSK